MEETISSAKIDMNTLIIISQVCPPTPVRVRTSRDYMTCMQVHNMYTYIENTCRAVRIYYLTMRPW